MRSRKVDERTLNQGNRLQNKKAQEKVYKLVGESVTHWDSW
jgi:hypothetical protein